MPLPLQLPHRSGRTVRPFADRIAARTLDRASALPQVIALHPRLDGEYRRQVDALEAALATPEAAIEVVPRLRAMIARIVVTPGPRMRGVQLEVVRQLDEVVAFATSHGSKDRNLA